MTEKKHASSKPESKANRLLEKVRDAVADRRRHSRHTALLPVQVMALGPDGKTVRFQATTLDLSFSGIRMHSPQPVPSGSRVTVTVRFPEHKVEVDAHCEVAWQRPVVSGGFDLGLRIYWKVPKEKGKN